MSRKPEIKEPFYASENYGYGPVEWAKVVRDLKTKLKIDIADTVLFTEPWNDRKPISKPLGDALQELASYYGALARLEDHRLTPRQRATKAKQILTKLKAAVTAINDYHDAGDTMELRVRSATVLRDLILQIEQRKQRYEKQAAMHNGRTENPIATHIRFWLALMKLWRAVPTSIGEQHKHLREFLMICSKPLFPAATREKTLTSFIERYFPQTNT
jgi:hypothetical protein